MRFSIINMCAITKYVCIYYFINYLKFISLYYLSRFHSFYYYLSYFYLIYLNYLNILLLKTFEFIIIFFF